MDAVELQKLAELESGHWWYRERRALLARDVKYLPPGRALDVGAAGGGNTQVLTALGWSAAALEFDAEAAHIAVERGVPAIRADACRIPVRSASVDLVIAFDVLEHLVDDQRAALEIARVLRPGGTALISVPCDMRLWSAHDVAVSHVRRYARPELARLVAEAGLIVERVESWNVLLRPVAAWRRRRSTGSDLAEVPSAVDLALSLVIRAERILPVGNLPGVSLRLRARMPA